MTAAIDAPLRVAMVIQSFAPVLGGAQRQVQALAPHLRATGADVTVITRRWERSAAIRERQPGLRLVRVPRSGPGPFGASAWFAGGSAAVTATRPDVIHAHDLLSPSMIALAAGAASRAPVVAKILSTGAGGDVDRLLTKPFGALRLRALVDRIAAFICLSEAVEDELLEYGAAPERLHRIPNGVDQERLRPVSSEERRAARQRLGLAVEEPLTVYCGRLHAVKRLDLLLEAFGTVPGRLVIAGDGPELPSIAAAAEHPSLRGRVTFMDTLPDPAPLYRAADVYASASLTEGMSNSVLEAMASGLAIAAAPASAMHELLRDGAGLVAESSSAPALAECLRRLVADPALRQAVGGVARRRVVARYSLDATARALMELYATVLEGRAATAP